MPPRQPGRTPISPAWSPTRRPGAQRPPTTATTAPTSWPRPTHRERPAQPARGQAPASPTTPRGNQTENKGTTYTWDSSGRLATETSGGTTVTYTYDALNRLIQRTKGSTTTRYSYCGYTTSPCAVLNSSSTMTAEITGGIGGVLVTIASSGHLYYSYPNLQGNYIVTTTYSGSQTRPVSYTPYRKGDHKDQRAKEPSIGWAQRGCFRRPR